MLASWFAARTPRPSHSDRLVRPWLEQLENRLTPSGGIFDHGGGHGPHGGGPPGGGSDGGGPPGGGPPVHINFHINAHDSFNTTITNSFNTGLNNVNVNQFFQFAPVGKTALQSGLASGIAMTPVGSVGDLINLVTDEMQLAADTYLTFIGMGSTSLNTQMHDLQTAIQQNPLEGTAIGEITGVLAFDLTLDLELTGALSSGSSSS